MRETNSTQMNEFTQFVSLTKCWHLYTFFSILGKTALCDQYFLCCHNFYFFKNCVKCLSEISYCLMNVCSHAWMFFVSFVSYWWKIISSSSWYAFLCNSPNKKLKNEDEFNSVMNRSNVLWSLLFLYSFRTLQCRYCTNEIR